MAILAISAGYILKSTFQLLTPTNFLGSWEPAQISKKKKEAAEDSILGIIKIGAAIPIYSALYVADLYLKRLELKFVVTLCAFCSHPSATIDYLFFRGFLIMRQGFSYSHKFARFVDNLSAQARTEGCGLPYRKGQPVPEESREKVQKIFDDLFAQHKSSIDAWLAKANQFYLNGGIRFLLGCIGSSWVLDNSDEWRIWANKPHLKPHSLFWLDRRMVSLAKQLASRWI